MNSRTANRLAKINRAQIALVHVAKRQLGLSDEEYRDALQAYGGAASSKDLNQEQFKAVLKHFGRCGFKQLYQPPQRQEKMPDIPRLPRVKQGIMYLIGTTLAALGKSWAYADGISGRMFGIERLEWCDKEQLQKVMAALVYLQRKSAQAAKGGAK